MAKSNVNTLAALQASVAAFKKAESGGTEARKTIGEKARDMYLSAARHASVNPRFSAEDMITLIWGKPEDKGFPKGRVLIQRRSDWGAILEAGRKAPQRFALEAGEALWNDTAKGVNGFRKVARLLAKQPKADDAALKAAVKVVEVTKNDGDFVADGTAAFTALLQNSDDDDVVNALAEPLCALNEVVQRLRSEGKLRTTAEIRRAEMGGRASKASLSDALAARANA